MPGPVSRRRAGLALLRDACSVIGEWLALQHPLRPGWSNRMIDSGGSVGALGDGESPMLTATGGCGRLEILSFDWWRLQPRRPAPASPAGRSARALFAGCLQQGTETNRWWPRPDGTAIRKSC